MLIIIAVLLSTIGLKVTVSMYCYHHPLLFPYFFCLQQAPQWILVPCNEEWPKPFVKYLGNKQFKLGCHFLLTLIRGCGSANVVPQRISCIFPPYPNWVVATHFSLIVRLNHPASTLSVDSMPRGQMAASSSNSRQSLLSSLVKALLPLYLRPLDQQRLKLQGWEANIWLLDP